MLAPGTSLVDTGPARHYLIEAGVAEHLVLIPTRPSALDIEQAAQSVELCERRGKPHAIILNAAPPSSNKLTKSSMQFQQHNGSTVIETPITYMAAVGRQKRCRGGDKG